MGSRIREIVKEGEWRERQTDRESTRESEQGIERETERERKVILIQARAKFKISVPRSVCGSAEYLISRKKQNSSPRSFTPY